MCVYVFIKNCPSIYVLLDNKGRHRFVLNTNPALKFKAGSTYVYVSKMSV